MCLSFLKTRSSITKNGLGLSTLSLHQYEFLDCGNGQKLERFGEVYVKRSCPTAVDWKPLLSDAVWKKADVCYSGVSGSAGNWVVYKNDGDIPEHWSVAFGSIQFSLALSEIGQLGVFPEQKVNWEWLSKTLKSNEEVNILNGFAYTGGSTLAALSAGSGVKAVHLDAAKSSVQWAKKNCELSGFGDRNVRFLVEDCMTFLNREIKRGNTYEGLIFDPPAFGRGPNGKVWKIGKDFPALIEMIPRLLSPSNPKCIVLSCHDTEWPSARIEELLRKQLKSFGGVFECVDMSLVSQVGGRNLPAGSCCRVQF